MADEYYDRIAQGYDELHEEEQLKKLRLIRETIENDDSLSGFKNPKSVLDVGCGTGVSTRFFEAQERHGIDPSRELIKIAVSKDPEGKYLVLGAEQMRYDKEFDITISLTAIQNFDDISRGLENIKRTAPRFILTFLKKSEKRPEIEKLIEERFKILKRLEEEKDMIYFCE